jgi:hypothetical protein
LIAPVACVLVAIRKLDPSTGRSGPHDFAVRADGARLAHASRPSHPALNVRDDRDTPLNARRDDMRKYQFLKKGKKIFRAGRRFRGEVAERSIQMSFSAQPLQW